MDGGKLPLRQISLLRNVATPWIYVEIIYMFINYTGKLGSTDFKQEKAVRMADSEPEHSDTIVITDILYLVFG